MSAPATAATAAPNSGPASARGTGWGYWILTGAGLLGAWLLKDHLDYQPGSPLGYNLGLAGGIAMLLLLLYAVRKRVRFMHNWLPLKYWFRAHMFLGVTGPLLIVFHSKLHLGSVNAAIAFFSMLAVFLSGLVGRVIYVRIHQGLYGRRTTRQELKQKLGMTEGEMKSAFHFAPLLESRLQRFETEILTAETHLLRRVDLFFTLWLRAAWTALRADRELKQALAARAQRRTWGAGELARRYARGRRVIRAFLRAVKAEAQFAAYEWLFSLWHVLHVPLVFLLIITAVIHVLAVHMY